MITREEILNMPAGRELDKLIAEMMEPKPDDITIDDLRERERRLDWYSSDEVLSSGGWWKAAIGTDAYVVNGYFSSSQGNTFAKWEPAQEPSIDIAAAWHVIGKMEQEDVDFSMSNVIPNSDEIVYEFVFTKAGKQYYACEFTAPLAICRAALLAVMDGGA